MNEMGVKKLAAEILSSALHDIGIREYGEKTKETIDAEKWIEDNSINTFGFKWCIDVCGVNPNYIKKCIERIQKSGGKTTMQDIKKEETN